MSPELLKAIIMWCNIAQLGPHTKNEKFELEKDCRQHLIACHEGSYSQAKAECFRRNKEWPKPTEEIL